MAPMSSTTSPSRPWYVLVPVKRLDLAKTRLGAVAGRRRSDLALAVAADTVAAALGCSVVRRVIAVTDDARARAELAALGAVVIGDEPDAGLNAALNHAAQHVRASEPQCGVAALSADLPAPMSLRRPWPTPDSTRGPSSPTPPRWERPCWPRGAG
jgi:2-phospho-L-lactate guanylyltransferase